MSRHSRARRSAEAALAKLYEGLPALECRGLCHRSCGPIPMSDFEVIRLEARLGGPLPPHMPAGTDIQAISCPLLTADRRCSVYQDRPLICRLWGLVDDDLMRCPFGCRPSRYLTDQESRAFLRKAEEISNRYRKEEAG